MIIDWRKRWPDRELIEACMDYQGDEDRIHAVIHIPRHRDTYHVCIWDEQVNPEQFTITDTEMIINHPGWSSIDEAKAWAERYLIRIKASEAGDA